MTDENTKLLQAILDNQAGLRRGQEDLNKKIDIKNSELQDRLTERIDALGKQLNVLDEDAPTRDEYDGLETRVVVLEGKNASS